MLGGQQEPRHYPPVKQEPRHYPPVKQYPIHEVFYTFQGEGCHMGLPALFIRTYGCPVKCPWCDSAGTWHQNYKPESVPKWTVSELVDATVYANADRVVITGGEPAIHDLSDLFLALRSRRTLVHVETSGILEIKGDADWITLSPKKWSPPIPEAIWKADEIKIIVEEPADIPLYLEMVGRDCPVGIPIWLHPEWSKREDKKVLSAIVQEVKRRRGGIIRAGWQLHKLYSADKYDTRSAPLVPLGGDPAKGY